MFSSISALFTCSNPKAVAVVSSGSTASLDGLVGLMSRTLSNDTIGDEPSTFAKRNNGGSNGLVGWVGTTFVNDNPVSVSYQQKIEKIRENLFD